MKFINLFKYPVFPLFIIGGLVLIIVGIYTDPSALTDDGYSLRWFWIALGSFYEVIVLAVLFGIYFFLRSGEKKEEWFKENGIMKEAKIIKTELTGTYINNNPVIEFELELKDNSGNTYIVNHKECVSMLNLNQIGKGLVIKVLVSPTNQKDITILL